MEHKRLVIVARTLLIMLAIAAAFLLGLGIFVLLRSDPPELSGWLRSVFGRVFATFAIGAAAMLGVPAVLGLWAMAGANADDASPALPMSARRVLAVVAVGTVVATGIVVATNLSVAFVVDLALVALVALGTLGLAGATSFSPHRGRAILCAVALVLVTIGTAWILRGILTFAG